MTFASWFRWSIFILLALSLTACAPPKTLSTWSAENYTGQLEKVMVIALSQQSMRRKMVENVFLRKLSARNVQVFPSHKYLPELGKDVTREVVLAKAEEIGVESILLVRTASSQDLSNVQPDRRSYGWVYASGDDFVFYGVGFIPAVREYDSEMYQVAAHVYYLPMGKMVWTSLSEVWVKESPESMVDPYTSLVLKQLTKSGLIQ